MLPDFYKSNLDIECLVYFVLKIKFCLAVSLVVGAPYISQW